MTLLYLGILIFAGTHLFSMLLPNMRRQVLANWGENSYKGVYSLASLLGVVLMAVGYWQARNGELAGVSYYQPAAGLRHATMSLVPIGFILIASNGGNGYIRKFVRHPFSIGFSLWAIGHLLANGEIYVVPIFAMFLALSVLDILLSTARGGRAEFAPSAKRDVIAVVAGLVAFAVFAFGFHPYILGLPVGS
jgi:uncharacterized membrane protein